MYSQQKLGSFLIAVLSIEYVCMEIVKENNGVNDKKLLLNYN